MMETKLDRNADTKSLNDQTDEGRQCSDNNEHSNHSCEVIESEIVNDHLPSGENMQYNNLKTKNENKITNTDVGDNMNLNIPIFEEKECLYDKQVETLTRNLRSNALKRTHDSNSNNFETVLERQVALVETNSTRENEEVALVETNSTRENEEKGYYRCRYTELLSNTYKNMKIDPEVVDVHTNRPLPSPPGDETQGSESPEAKRRRMEIIASQCRLHPANEKYNQGPVVNPPPISPGIVVAYTPGGQRYEVNLNFQRPTWFDSEYARMQFDCATKINVGRMMHDLTTGHYLPDTLDPDVERQYFKMRALAKEAATKHFENREVSEESSDNDDESSDDDDESSDDDDEAQDNDDEAQDNDDEAQDNDDEAQDNDDEAQDNDDEAQDNTEQDDPCEERASGPNKIHKIQFLETERQLIETIEFALVQIKDFPNEVNKKLEALMNEQLYPLMFLKNPPIVEIIEQLSRQCIHIEVVSSARALFDKIKLLFDVPTSQTFLQYFNSEVKRLEEKTKDMAIIDLMMMTEEPEELITSIDSAEAPGQHSNTNDVARDESHEEELEEEQAEQEEESDPPREPEDEWEPVQEGDNWVDIYEQIRDDVDWEDYSLDTLDVMRHIDELYCIVINDGNEE